jgi:SAM-dependent methyltransferase
MSDGSTHDAARTGRDGPSPPRYIDALLGDFDGADDHRWNHLGHWDEPAEAVPGSRVRAQERMNDVVVSLADVADGRAVLDVGCGFGGTLQSIDSRFERMELVGLDIDVRQLRVCTRLVPRRTNSLGWVNGDACHLPFPSSRFDSVISIEALWHVPSRREFLHEAGRVLRASGALAVVDILIEPDAADSMGISRREMLETLERGFAPWPEPTTTLEDVLGHAAAAGLECESVIDATDNTVPTYLDHGDSTQRPGAATFSRNDGVRLFVELHRRRCLKVVYLSFTARNSS